MKFTTNDYTKVLGNWTQSNERYQGDKGSPYDGENLIDDSDYTNGGANWRNYDYATNNGSTAGEEDRNVPAQTVQLWEMNGILKTVTWIITGRTSKNG